MMCQMIDEADTAGGRVSIRFSTVYKSSCIYQMRILPRLKNDSWIIIGSVAEGLEKLSKNILTVEEIYGE